MADPGDQEILAQQQELFSRIARRYDLVNHLMTGWLDTAWRRFAVQQLRPGQTARILDLGSGSGQLSREILRQRPGNQPIAADLTRQMLEIGRQQGGSDRILWTQVDAGRLPFPGDCFEGVISGFLVRNLSDPIQGLREQYRVLKPGGRIAVLDTSRPPQNLLSPLVGYYMSTIMPALGGLVTGYQAAYRYLDRSTAGFLRPEELAACLEEAGFRAVAFRKFALGVVAVHWGEK